MKQPHWGCREKSILEMKTDYDPRQKEYMEHCPLTDKVATFWEMKPQLKNPEIEKLNNFSLLEW